MHLPPEEAAVLVSGVGRNPDYGEEGWRGISPFVTSSVLWSLYSFLRSPEDYWETVCTAIAVGGDVDTTGGHGGRHQRGLRGTRRGTLATRPAPHGPGHLGLR
jgi:hypothetical protein